MAGEMMLHTGGWAASETEVMAVALPEKTATYTPIEHIRFVDQFREAAEIAGLTITKTRFALSKEGQRMFFVMDTEGHDGMNLTIGGRNSYDGSMAAAALGGSRVWICDNLAMTAEIVLRQLHRGDVWDRLPGRVQVMCSRLVDNHGGFERHVDTWKAQELDQRWIDHALMNALRADAIRMQDVQPIEAEYHKPTIEAWKQEPDTAWKLFNAATQVAKGWSEQQQIIRTQKLSSVWKQTFSPGLIAPAIETEL